MRLCDFGFQVSGLRFLVSGSGSEVSGWRAGDADHGELAGEVSRRKREHLARSLSLFAHESHLQGAGCGEGVVRV